MAEPSPVALFWGEDEFLLRLAAHQFLEARGLRAREVEAAEWRGGEASDLATPSLWGEPRALLVTGCQALPRSAARELVDYVRSPSPDAVCVLTVVSAGRGAPALARQVEAAGGLVRQVALRRQDVPRWVLDRARARGLRLSPQGAAALTGVLGEDPATLDQAVEQLATAFPGQAVGPDHVRDQFRGVGDQQVWDLCDHALSGRLPAALVSLRSLLESRHDPLLILGGIASRVRDLIRVRDLPDALSGPEAARAAGLRFDWQLRRYREQAHRFPGSSLVELHGRVVEADRALKGGVPPEVVLASLVAVLAGESEAALDTPIRASR